MSTYDDLQPQSVWQIFGDISKIPRGSGNEAAVMTMLEKWAAQHGLETRRDAVGNMLVSIPASRATGYATSCPSGCCGSHRTKSGSRSRSSTTGATLTAYLAPPTATGYAGTGRQALT